MIKTVFLCGSETEDTKRNVVVVVEMVSIKILTRIPRLVKVRNEDIKSINCIEGSSKLEEMERKKLLRYGYIEHMDTPFQEGYEKDTPRTKKLGIPRKSWLEGIRKTTSVRNLKEDNRDNRRGWLPGFRNFEKCSNPITIPSVQTIT